jgi:hypothetical protein
MEIINIFLIFVSLALLIGLMSVLYFYLKLFKKLAAQEKELKKHYLKKAITEASEIVEEAGQEALDILSASNSVNQKDQSVLDEVVKQIAQDQSSFLKASVDQLMQEFRAELQQVKNYNIKTLTNVSKDIESNTSSQLTGYVKALEEETVESEKTINKKIDASYKMVQDEVIEYKNEQLKKIDANIESLLKKISIEVLERTITPQDHKDIILKMLEEAKSESLFAN